MAYKIIIVGSGFAGVWSALSAQRLVNLRNKTHQVQVIVISPQPFLVIRPRLYEADPAKKTFPLQDLFDQARIQHLSGTVKTIDHARQSIVVQSSEEEIPDSSMTYDRLVLAAGSTLSRPASVIGIDHFAFDVDCLESAVKLEKHLAGLATLPSTSIRNTIVVCGGGFTGIELATELPSRLGQASPFRIVLVERAGVVGPELGPGPRPSIEQALKQSGVVVRTGCTVNAIDSMGVTLASGERIDAMTVIWTAGPKATSLVQDVPGAKDLHGRLQVDQTLRAPLSEKIFASGDAAHVFADDDGHVALMSCQHALFLGRVSGHNAVANLLGEPLIDYVQKGYTCCLDLGEWGAVVSQGWEREVSVTGSLAKRVKRYINGTLIYPPLDVDDALRSAGPVELGEDELFSSLMAAVA